MGWLLKSSLGLVASHRNSQQVVSAARVDQHQSLRSSDRVNSLGGCIFFVASAKTAIDEVRCEPARRWLSERLSVLPAKSAVWADKFNAKRILRGLCHSHVQQ
eukprot:2835060-Pyramimonas_sp.AAC.1